MSTEHTLWMGDIEPWMNENIIMKLFNDAGIYPSSIKLKRDKVSNKLRNYCFINFHNIIEANETIYKLNGKKVLNSNFKFKLNWASQHSENNLNLFIGNLSPDVDGLTLYTIFKNIYKSVHHVTVVTENGISKMYGFVHFSDKNDYDRCLKEMDGYIIYGNPIKVNERKNNNLDKKNKDKNFQKNINYNKNFINDFSLINSNVINLNEEYSYYPKNLIITKEEPKKIGNFINFEKQKKNSKKNNTCPYTYPKALLIDNLSILKSNNLNVLYEKIQEGIHKILSYYKVNERKYKTFIIFSIENDNLLLLEY